VKNVFHNEIRAMERALTIIEISDVKKEILKPSSEKRGGSITYRNLKNNGSKVPFGEVYGCLVSVAEYGGCNGRSEITINGKRISWSPKAVSAVRNTFETFDMLKVLKEKGITEILANSNDGCSISVSRLGKIGLQPKKVGETIYYIAKGAHGSLPEDSVNYDGTNLHIGEDVTRAFLSACKGSKYLTA